MKKVRKLRVLRLIGILMVMLSIPALRTQAQSGLELRLNSIRKKFKQCESENLYVQTDRDVYVIGDTILVKAFLFPKPSPKISDGDSRFIYLDLVNNEGVVMNREKIIIDSTTGTFNGYVRLYDNVKPGEYEIQAYTYWMQNKGKEGFFTKGIFISDSATSGIIPKKEDNKGGNLSLELVPKTGSYIQYQINNATNIDDKYILAWSDYDILTLTKTRKSGALSIDSDVPKGMIYFSVIDENGKIYDTKTWYAPGCNGALPELNIAQINSDNTIKISAKNLPTNANIAVSVVPLEYLYEESLHSGNMEPNFKSIDELEKMLESSNSNTFEKESDMILEGYVVNRKGKVMTNNIVKRSGQMIRNGVVSLFGEDYMIYFAYPDNNGYFKRGEIFWDNETRFYSEYETYAGVRDIYLQLKSPKFLNEFDYSYLAKQNTRTKADKNSAEWSDSQARTLEKHRVYGADFYTISPTIPGGAIASSYNNPYPAMHTTSKYNIKASKSYIRAKNRPSMKRLIEYAPQKIRNVGYNQTMTLYWNGNATIDSTNPFVIQLPTTINNNYKKIAVIVSGITADGAPIYKTSVIDI